jgi:hypothetical protein
MGKFKISDDPTRAWSRMSLINADDSNDKLYALCNPEALSLSLSVDVGELKPVGWSHPVQMYGSTGAWTIPVKLYWSQFILIYRGHKVKNIGTAITWLSRFVYPKERGLAPSRLILAWPNVLTIPCVLRSIAITHSKFDTFLEATVSEVELQLTSYRRNFIAAYTQSEKAFFWSDDEPLDDHGSPVEPSGDTGLPVRYGCTNVKVE